MSQKAGMGRGREDSAAERAEADCGWDGRSEIQKQVLRLRSAHWRAPNFAQDDIQFGAGIEGGQ